MKNKKFIKELIKKANYYDSIGDFKSADRIDLKINKLSSFSDFMDANRSACEECQDPTLEEWLGMFDDWEEDEKRVAAYYALKESYGKEYENLSKDFKDKAMKQWRGAIKDSMVLEEGDLPTEDFSEEE